MNNSSGMDGKVQYLSWEAIGFFRIGRIGMGKMHTRDSIVGLLQNERSFLAKEYGIGKMGLFGSYANGQPGSNSDVDILVEFEHPIGIRFVELVEYLESLGRKVDLLTPAGIGNIRIGKVEKNILDGMVYV